jgi:hypothetical protein
MSALSRQPESPLLVADWQPDVTQLLDEHHLVASSEFPARRLQFATSLGQFLGMQRDTEVCSFYGRFITDLDSFCYQLERAVPGPLLDRRIDGPGGVAALLRNRLIVRGKPATKFRYYLWHDADLLLRREPMVFAKLVDAIAGVAAEAEYVSDDLLLIHRAVFIGGPLLADVSKDERGPFRSWLADEFGEPFWRVVTGLENPPFMTYSVDALAK